MKILFTGGSTGGHFYPILAVAEEVNRIADERNLIKPDLYYIAPDPYDERLLAENDITYFSAPAGKIRRYPSIKNFFDLFKTAIGIVRAIFLMFSIFPDVVFSKGSYSSFPTVFAARVFGIPVIIHDSDASPGRANLWASKFAYRIAVSHPQAIDYFDKKVHDRIALTGNPIRKGIAHPAEQGAHEFLGFSKEIPTLLILGGSQGAKIINDAIIDALPEMIERYQIVHQTGSDNEAEVRGMATISLEENPYKNRYKAFGYLNDLAMRMSAGAADLVISRAGSAIFEIASWQKPAIIVPINEQVSHDQRKNAYAYARTGAAIVIEEHNLTPHVLLSEINRIMDTPGLKDSMIAATQDLSHPDAATKIAMEILSIGVKHEE